MVLQSDIDLLHPPAELEKRSHKLKRLYHGILALSKCSDVWIMFNHALHTNGRQGQVDRRLLLPPKERIGRFQIPVDRSSVTIAAAMLTVARIFQMCARKWGCNVDAVADLDVVVLTKL